MHFFTKGKGLLLLILGTGFLLAGGCLAAAQPQTGFEPQDEPVFSILPEPLPRGAPGRLLITGLGTDKLPEAVFDHKPIFFFQSSLGLIGLFGADIMLSPGQYPLEIKWKQNTEKASRILNISIIDKTYGIRTINVPQNQVDLSPEDLKRTEAEKILTTNALNTRSPNRLWHGDFVEPVQGQVNSSFGRQTRLNGVLNPRPHAGADYLVPEGTIVRAPASGQVILTGNHFFSGNSVYIDHGQGLISMYFHLSKILVSDGTMVQKGEEIAEVGKTGRVTGAHLHYGVYLNGARIDPIVFRQMTTKLGE